MQLQYFSVLQQDSLTLNRDGLISDSSDFVDVMLASNGIFSVSVTFACLYSL